MLLTMQIFPMIGNLMVTTSPELIFLLIMSPPMSFSCKSAVLKNGVLSISSYRTTKYKTLAEKLDYHDSTEAKPFSHYAIVVRDMSILMLKSYLGKKAVVPEAKPKAILMAGAVLVIS
jgi:hypothetical protein